jgi:hypothetical protein
MGGRKDGYKGGVYVWALVKQNKKAKICFVIHIAGIIFKKISVDDDAF